VSSRAIPGAAARRQEGGGRHGDGGGGWLQLTRHHDRQDVCEGDGVRDASVHRSPVRARQR
jgi:hypothetical protein